MGVIASEAKQSLPFRNEIATACKAGLAMTTPQIDSKTALLGQRRFEFRQFRLSNGFCVQIAEDDTVFVV